jgi:hypothetical protein
VTYNLSFAGGYSGRIDERIPSPAEMDARLVSLMNSPAGGLIGRSLGLGDPNDPREMSPDWAAAPQSARG